MYSLSAFKWHKSNIRNLLMESSEILLIFLAAFYLIIWLMTFPKNSEKISILKIWQLAFFWNVKISFGKFLLWCIFRHGKIWFSQIMPFNSYYFHLMYSVLYLYDILIIYGDHDIHKKQFLLSWINISMRN